MPFEQEGVGGLTFAGSESTTTLVTFGALDKEASRLVVETWPFAPLADGAGVELIASSFIFGHAWLRSKFITGPVAFVLPSQISRLWAI